jgi:hypothetical protein
VHLNKTFKFSSFRFAKNYLLLANKKILTKDEINNAKKAYLRWEYFKASKNRAK